ncbi:MAG: YraN family protein [Chloroflexi bacterium]|nr:YraN family protein [Chloroflexota bacterium]MQC27148.1 YraN family protein [Chloroflexota bacterium]
MSSKKQRLGRWGEQQAADYLTSRGYQIIARNVRTEHGELDLVARQGSDLVFVEVKARSSAVFGHPEEAVTPNKQQHILEAAQTYLQENPQLEGGWRIDVIALRRRPGAEPEIRHFENAFN